MAEARWVGEVKWFDATKKEGRILPYEEDEEISFYLDVDDNRMLRVSQVVAFTKVTTEVEIQEKTYSLTLAMDIEILEQRIQAL